MKCIILFLLLVTFPLNLFCQGEKVVVLDSTLSDIWYLFIDEHHRYRHTYTYDFRGNLMEDLVCVDYEKNSDNWSRESLKANTYDSEGRLTEKADYYGWRNETWEYGSRTVYAYDSKGNLAAETLYGLYPGTNDWQEDDHREYTYNTHGFLVEEIHFRRDSKTSDRVNRDRLVFLYDSSGNQTEQIQYGWDSEIDNWVGNDRNVYSYNSDAALSEHVHYRWHAESKMWYPFGMFCFHGACWSDKIEYLYDTAGKIREEASFNWDSASADWVKIESKVYVYDGGGNLTEKTQRNWPWVDLDSSSIDLTGSFRDVFSYDGHGNQTEHIYFFWDSDINDWRESDRNVYSYDVNGNQTEHIYYDWNSDTNSWRGEDRNVYSYDFSGNLMEQIRYRWIRDTGWEMNERTRSYWSSQLLVPKAFYVDENCLDCSTAGTLTTGGFYPREKITFQMIEANVENMFDLDTVTGEIKILDAGQLDYETRSSYHITIRAQYEQGDSIIADTAVIDIYVNNVNDNAPVINDTIFYLDENTKIWNPVGQVIGTDADMDPLVYSITAGNDDSAFYIHYRSGNIITNTKDIDYETRDYYSVTVRASDGVFADEAIAEIYINDIEETSTGYINCKHPIKIYPNPANQMVYLDVPEEFIDGFEVEIIGVSGRMVFQRSGYIEQLDLSSFRKGVYLITIRSKDFVTTRKVMKL